MTNTDSAPVDLVLPKIYSVKDHSIPPNKIDPHAVQVIQKLRQGGHKAYLVGGSVRDLLLQVTPKDFDVSTSAKPEEIRATFRNALLIGRRFRLAHVRFGKKVIEVSTFRAGETGAELIVRDNVWGTEEEDVLRRDFTINGLYYDPESQEILDYVEGYADLQKKILRTIGNPKIRFTQDPVRMIRLLKFCARFRFEIEQSTFAALLECKHQISKSSSSRILEELFRMLESGSAKPFFHLLHEYGLLYPLLPELAHYMQMRSENQILSILGEVDAEVKKQENPLDRSLLIAGLIFPLFDEYLKTQSEGLEKPLHLGQIAEASHYVIENLFSPFFKIPRRIRVIVSFLITTQYRLLPLGKPPARKIRLPNDPFFSMALHLLKLRAAIQPDLLPHYTHWTEAAYASHSADPGLLPSREPERPRRRRRRRRHTHGPS